MNRSPAIDDPRLDAAQAAEFAAIKSLLDLSGGAFSLSSVICDDVALERRLIQDLIETRPSLVHMALSTTTLDAFDLVHGRLESTVPSGLLVSGFVDWLASADTGPQRVRALNASRELWQRMFTCPVLFWMNTTVAVRLAYEAPDLWRYRSHRFDLTVTVSALHTRGIPMTGAQNVPGGDYLSLSQENKRNRITELQQRLAEVNDRSPIQVRQHAVQWMLELGNLNAVLGMMHEAMAQYQQALAIAREIGDRRAEGAALGNLGLAYADLGEVRRAIECHQQALVISREVGDRRGEGSALGNLGLAYANLGEVRRATEFHEQYLAIAREIGDRQGEGNALGNLGSAYYRLGEVRRAIEFYEQCLTIHREIGDRGGEGNALGNLGNAYADLGEVRRAIEFYEQCLVIQREIGDRRGEGNALWNSAVAYEKLNDRSKAISLAQQALAIYEQIEDPNAAMVRQQLEQWRGR